LIIDNDAMISLSGLEGLTYIVGDLFIGWNKSLTGLEALYKLSTVGGSLKITSNDAISSLKGLDNIKSATISTLKIKRNPYLSTCAVQSVCDYLADPNGAIVIFGNAPGCNSQVEVEKACTIKSAPAARISQKLAIYPNPFSTTITIEHNFEEQGYIHFAIYNQIGELVELIADGVRQEGSFQFTWSAIDQPAGVYFCVLRTEGGTETTKIIKLK